MSIPLDPSQSSRAAHQEPPSEPSQFDPPIPSGSEGWADCDLGHPNSWSAEVRAFTSTVAALAYPAAILYGDDLVLFHNKAWADASSTAHQGRSQRGHLSANVWRAFQSGLQGAPASSLTSSDVLRNGADPASDDHTVCLSRLHHGIDGKSVSLLVQLLPRTVISPSAEYTENHAMQMDRELSRQTSHRKASESTPLNKHPFFHHFAEMLPCGLAILDHEAEAVYVNQVFYSLTTFRDSDQDFYAWPESIHPDDKERVLGAYRKAFKDKAELRTEFRSFGNESHPWRLLLLTPLDTNNLKHLSLDGEGGFLCCIVDISSEKSAELAERKAAQEAEERKTILSKFIDTVSHEIRNPLSAVLHCSEDINDALQEHPIPAPKIKEAVETINLCIVHQKNIVDDILSFSKLDASMLTLVPSRSQPAIDIANSIRIFKPELRKSSIGFDFHIDESYSECDIEWVMVDVARIGQVLVNLMSNAIKFTARSQGEKQISVSIGASKSRPTSFPSNVVFFKPDESAYHMEGTNSNDWGNGETVYIAVAVHDTGIGISETDQAKLFERFRQAKPMTSETYGGSGLGLNICRKICQLHGGEVGVHAVEGDGSTFAFFFKAKRSETGDAVGEGRDDADRRLDAQIRDLNVTKEGVRRPPFQRSSGSNMTSEGQPSQASAGSQSSGLQVQEDAVDTEATKDDEVDGIRDDEGGQARQNAKTHVLLVEDNLINQKLLFRKLESKGFAVTAANNGREAIDAVTSSGEKPSFDIILMDNEMPILDGNSAAKELRELETRGQIQHVPIIGVTANVRDAQQEQMRESGMEDVISKPYRIEDMVQRINEILKDAEASHKQDSNSDKNVKTTEAHAGAEENA